MRPRFIRPVKFIKTRHSNCLRSWLLGPPAMTTGNKLVKLLEDIMDDIRILIFMDTKKGCDQITRQLRMNGWPALSIHGDKSQVERDWVLSKFKANDCNRCCCSWSSLWFTAMQFTETAMQFVVHCTAGSFSYDFFPKRVLNPSIVVVAGRHFWSSLVARRRFRFWGNRLELLKERMKNRLRSLVVFDDGRTNGLLVFDDRWWSSMIVGGLEVSGGEVEEVSGGEVETSRE
ncbi:unnamed protein product [Prunus armeniaca]|uniref:Helicase C-terminal domain-containing protein n=1 Tax=Prunus armeniaca TaxID=36596 RepID=A0A6J5VA85_PRUAR|nr:unnamed protein product [Prunus armeniaca]